MVSESNFSYLWSSTKKISTLNCRPTLRWSLHRSPFSCESTTHQKYTHKQETDSEIVMWTILSLNTCSELLIPYSLHFRAPTPPPPPRIRIFQSVRQIRQTGNRKLEASEQTEIVKRSLQKEIVMNKCMGSNANQHSLANKTTKRETKRERERERDTHTHTHTHRWWCFIIQG